MSLLVSAEHAEQLVIQTEEAALTEDYEATERLSRELVEVMAILHGPDHIEVGIAQFYLALALEEQGRIAESMRVRRKARKILLSQGCWLN